MTARIRYLDGARLQRGLQAGIARLVTRRDYLNRINVFPVPDGDTGTNLAFTLLAISQLRPAADAGVGQVMAAMADAALDGSRGNSGAIFAQFLQGVREASAGLELLDAAQFAAAVQHGARSAWEAVSDPREGTMLSVIRDYAGELVQRTQQGTDDFTALLGHGLEQARRSLAKTPEQLEVLRRAGVVDAGAQGFVDFLEGVGEFIHEGSLREFDAAALHVVDEAAVMAGHDGEITHRYCVECRLSGEAIDRRALRGELEPLGDSLVVAGSDTLVHLHMHVDDPAAMFRAAGGHGLVSGHKADDMELQRRITRGRREKVAISTDTAADLPDEIRARYPIYPVSLRVNFGVVEEIDKVSIRPGDFYARLRREALRVRTSQPPVGDFRRAFEYLASHHDQVLSINLSGALSGTCGAARTAADAVGATVFDSLNGAGGQGLLTIVAAEMADAGYPIDAILRRLETLRPLSRTFAAVADLSYAVRGGRVTPLRKRIADLLGVTPVIGVSAKGQIKTAGLLPGRRDIGPKLARLVARRMGRHDRLRLIVGHCDHAEAADACERELRRRLPQIESLWRVEAGTAIGVHAGPGSLIVGAQPFTPVAPWRDGG